MKVLSCQKPIFRCWPYLFFTSTAYLIFQAMLDISIFRQQLVQQSIFDTRMLPT